MTKLIPTTAEERADALRFAAEALRFAPDEVWFHRNFLRRLCADIDRLTAERDALLAELRGLRARSCWTVEQVGTAVGKVMEAAVCAGDLTPSDRLFKGDVVATICEAVVAVLSATEEDKPNG